MGLFAEKFETLRDLYVNELRDLHSAQLQLTTALPKMAEVATSSQLKNALTTHLEQTRGHVRRLEQIFNALGEKPSGKTCEAMEGLIAEGESYVKASGDDSVRDAGLIGAAQRVEHYEIAGYGTARSLANRLGEKNAAELLQRTLEEEGDADHKLSEIAEGEFTSLPPAQKPPDSEFLTDITLPLEVSSEKQWSARAKPRRPRFFLQGLFSLL